MTTSRADLILSTLEHRMDRPYDDASPSHLLMPNGSKVASFDRAFLGAAGREVLRLWEAVYGVPAALPEPHRCARCDEPIHYQRAAHAGGGDSTWVHTETGSPVCADREGRCERPPNYRGAAA